MKNQHLAVLLACKTVVLKTPLVNQPVMLTSPYYKPHNRVSYGLWSLFVCQSYSPEIITNSSLKTPCTALRWGGINAGTVPHTLSFVRDNRFHVHLVRRYMPDALGATDFMHISSAGMCQTQHTSSSVLHEVFTSGSRLGRSEVLRSLRQYLKARSQGSHTTNHLEERGMERGSTQWSSLKGWERAIVNQMNIGTVSKATSGTLLREGWSV